MTKHTFISSFHHPTKGTWTHACQPALLVLCVVSVDELQYSTKNKQRRLASTLSTFNTAMMETRDDDVFDHNKEMVS